MRPLPLRMRLPTPEPPAERLPGTRTPQVQARVGTHRERKPRLTCGVRGEARTRSVWQPALLVTGRPSRRSGGCEAARHRAHPKRADPATAMVARQGSDPLNVTVPLAR